MGAETDSGRQREGLRRTPRQALLIAFCTTVGCIAIWVFMSYVHRDPLDFQTTVIGGAILFAVIFVEALTLRWIWAALSWIFR